jgi:ferredoxin-NADP reductase
MADSQVRPAGAARIWAGGLSAATMLTLVRLMVPARDFPRSNLADSAVWWYAARASGLVAWVLLAVSVVGGLVLITRLTRGSARAWILGLHEFVGVLAVVFTGIHLVSVFATNQLRIGLWELLVPFTRPNNPVAQGCGVLALYLLTAVMVTSWARASLPWRWWRRLHLLTFPLFALACAHTALAGTDTTNPILHWASLLVGAVILFLAGLRLFAIRTARRAAAVPAPTVEVPEPRVPALRVPQQRQVSPFTTPIPAETGMSLLIGQTTWEADNVVSLCLHFTDRAPLPSWEPGAHIELVLPSGRRRQYSLCGDPQDRSAYRIAVLQVPTGRGGSVEIHAAIRVGQLIAVHGPRNHFPLEPSPAYLFIAGGIGITAVLAMATRLVTIGGEWKLVYTGRRRSSMAFIDEVCALGPDRVEVIPGDERGRPDLDAIIGSASSGTSVYCCGPEGLLAAVRERIDARPALRLHTELFVGGGPTGGPTGGAAFHVELSRTGRVIAVPDDRTVLQAVRDVLPTFPAGCEQGVCGACRTKVLAGEPDHRDGLLSSAERAAGVMLICVSRARSKRLTLDL